MSALRSVAVVGFALCGCAESPPPSRTHVGVDAAPSEGCLEGAGTCSGATYSVCMAGNFVPVETCEGAESCVPGQGCVACGPGAGAVCDGDALFACAADGSRGEKIRDCEQGCAEGRCLTECAPGAELIYVVDSANNLLSYDPRTDAFDEVGQLDCPAGFTWPEFGDGAATPFSMAIDRNARAWVLFSSGEIFWVDTRTAACQASPFPAGANGFELFGMAFVSDGPGLQTETLHVAGGEAGEIDRGRLGTVDASGRAVRDVGRLPAHEFGAELTGNGNGELWAYWPGPEASIARLDKATAAVDQEWALPGRGAQPAAWAFAHWGGRYHVFLTVRDAGGRFHSQVLRFDPGTGETEVAVEETGHRIVGAGVSTCAPVAGNF